MSDTSATSICIHGIRRIEIGEIQKLDSVSGFSLRLTMPMMAGETAPTTIILFSDDHDAFDALMSDADQADIDASEPHPMSTDVLRQSPSCCQD